MNHKELDREWVFLFGFLIRNWIEIEAVKNLLTLNIKAGNISMCLFGYTSLYYSGRVRCHSWLIHVP